MEKSKTHNLSNIICYKSATTSKIIVTSRENTKKVFLTSDPITPTNIIKVAHKSVNLLNQDNLINESNNFIIDQPIKALSKSLKEDSNCDALIFATKLICCILCEEPLTLRSSAFCASHPTCLFCLKQLLYSYLGNGLLLPECPFMHCEVEFDCGYIFKSLSSSYQTRYLRLMANEEKINFLFSKLKSGHLLGNDLGNSFIIACLFCGKATMYGVSQKFNVLCLNCNFRFCKYCFKEKNGKCCVAKDEEYKTKSNKIANLGVSFVAISWTALWLAAFPTRVARGSRTSRLVQQVLMFPLMMFVFILLLPFSSVICFVLK